MCARFGDPAVLDKYDTVFVDSITVAGRLCLQWCKGQPQAYSEKTGNLLLGAIVGRDSTTGKLKALDPAATDGTENAVGVLATDVDATLIDREDALLISRHAIVATHALVWPVAITPTEKTTAIAQLEARGVLVRIAA